MFGFLFGTQSEEASVEASIEPKEPQAKFIKVPMKQKPSSVIFIVLHKNTQEPIGVFNELEEAIAQGKASTYCNCVVYQFKLNDKCVYLNRPVYEDN